jgi:hypothetical protein
MHVWKSARAPLHDTSRRVPRVDSMVNWMLSPSPKLSAMPSPSVTMVLMMFPP